MKFTNFPKWIKSLVLLSSLIIIALISFILFIYFTKELGITSLLIIMLSSIAIGIIIGLWSLGFLTNYLIKKKKIYFANIISIIGLLGSVTWLIISIINFNNSLTPLFSSPSFVINGSIFLIIIYFLISLKSINKNK